MMKKLLKRNQLKGLKIVFLDSGKSSIALEEFDDIFDFFNYLFENNYDRKKFRIHCYDTKKAHLLIHLLDE